MAETPSKMPRLHVYGSEGEHYTENAPQHLGGIARKMDEIRSPAHIVYDGRKLFVGTRINAESLTPKTNRSERFVLFTEHDPANSGVKDAIIRHFGAIGRFNEKAGNYELNKAAMPGAKLKDAHFDTANATHGNRTSVLITGRAPYESAPLEEFIESLRKPSPAAVHAEAVKKILEAPTGDTVHASLKTNNAAEMVDAIAQVAQAHIKQRPGEPFEVAMPRLLQGAGRPHKTISINPERMLSAIQSIKRIDLETGEAVVPKPREPPAPAKKPGLFGSLFRK